MLHAGIVSCYLPGGNFNPGVGFALTLSGNAPAPVISTPPLVWQRYGIE
jgi:hypothetical protein